MAVTHSLSMCVCVCEHDIVWPWNGNKKNPLSDFGNRARPKKTKKNSVCFSFNFLSFSLLWVSILCVARLPLNYIFSSYLFVLVSLNYSDPLKHFSTAVVFNRGVAAPLGALKSSIGVPPISELDVFLRVLDVFLRVNCNQGYHQIDL